MVEQNPSNHFDGNSGFGRPEWVHQSSKEKILAEVESELDRLSPILLKYRATVEKKTREGVVTGELPAKIEVVLKGLEPEALMFQAQEMRNTLCESGISQMLFDCLHSSDPVVMNDRGLYCASLIFYRDFSFDFEISTIKNEKKMYNRPEEGDRAGEYDEVRETMDYDEDVEEYFEPITSVGDMALGRRLYTRKKKESYARFKYITRAVRKELNDLGLQAVRIARLAKDPEKKFKFPCVLFIKLEGKDPNELVGEAWKLIEILADRIESNELRGCLRQYSGEPVGRGNGTFATFIPIYMELLPQSEFDERHSLS